MGVICHFSRRTSVNAHLGPRMGREGFFLQISSHYFGSTYQKWGEEWENKCAKGVGAKSLQGARSSEENAQVLQ